LQRLQPSLAPSHEYRHTQGPTRSLFGYGRLLWLARDGVADDTPRDRRERDDALDNATGLRLRIKQSLAVRITEAHIELALYLKTENSLIDQVI
jgi:hypothetical protein